MRIRIGAVMAALCVASGAAAAQSPQVEGHANYARGNDTHLNSWGGGASYQLTWGAKNAPVQLGTSLGGDYQKQEGQSSGTSSVSGDFTVQPGGGLAIAPYVGGSVSANWMSGTGTLLGLQYIAGAQVKLGKDSPLSLKVEFRPGYVRTQEHSMSGRAGIALSF